MAESVIDILLDDLSKTFDNDPAKEDYSRRAVVRNSFALVEGMLNVHFDILRVYYQASLHKNFDPEAMQNFCIASQAAIGLKPSGRVDCSSQNLSLAPRVKFALNQTAEITGQQKPNYNTTQWTYFTKAIEIRDNLMHPKSVEDLHVSKEAFEQVKRGVIWVLTEFTKGRGPVARAAKAISDDLRSNLDLLIGTEYRDPEERS